jgi:hypothetical protein
MRWPYHLSDPLRMPASAEAKTKSTIVLDGSAWRSDRSIVHHGV